MATLSINELTTYSWSFEEDVQHYVDLGIEAIGIWRQKLSDFGEEKGVELLRDSGLVASSLMWAGGFTGSDGRSYRDSVQDARDSIRLAAELGAPSLIVYSGGRAGHTRNHARRLFQSALRELTPFAEEHGVLLAIEPMHEGCATDFTFMTSLDDCVAAMDEADSQHVRIAFDTYHMGHDRDNLSRLAQIVDRIAIVQLGDAKSIPDGEQNRCALGEGDLPLEEIVSCLEEAGYDGFYDIELLGEDLELTDYQDVLREAKQAFEQLISASNAT